MTCTHNHPHSSSAFANTSAGGTPLRSRVRLKLLPLLLLILAPTAGIRAQTCEDQGIPGDADIGTASVKIDSSGAGVGIGMVVQPGTKLRLDAMAYAYGNCLDMVYSPEGCITAASYNRDVLKITIWADISSTGPNGTYQIGNIYGKDSDGTTTSLNVINSESSNTTGPKYYTPFDSGTYVFHFQAIFRQTNCNITPDRSRILTATVYVGEKSDENNGEPDCKEGVGEPVNVTNGNMYLEQTDYDLPGAGGGLQIARRYNSQLLRAGMFGYGWTTAFEEYIEPSGTKFLRLRWGDGRAVFFSRAGEGDPYLPQETFDFHGQIVRHADGSYTLTLKDGAVHQFNAAGKLFSITDQNNNQTLLTYDANGRAITITDPSGRMLTLAYNANGYVTSISDGLGVIATYTYNSSRLLTVTYADGSQYKFSHVLVQSRYVITTVKDALDNVLESHAYDSQRRALTSERHGGVERYTLSYVSPTETHVTDALGHLTKYFFDKSKGRNLVTRVEGHCDCGGSRVETWAYDDKLNVTSRTNALNQTTTYTYDANGNRLSEADALGTTRYTYNSLGQVLTTVDPMNGETRNEYNARGNLLSTTDAAGGVASYTYDARGLLLTVTDPRRNVVSRFEYDTNGNLTRETDALNNSATFVYDARGRLTSTTDAENNMTGYVHDAAGRVKIVTQPDNSTISLTYDLAGRRTRVTDARNNSTNYTYDTAYRLTRVTDAANHATNYSYDLMSNLTGVTDALGRTTNYAYDDLHRLSRITYPEASAGAGRLEERFTYDAAGNLTQKIDRAGRATNFTYDTADRLTKATDPAMQETHYEYNARSQAVALVDAVNQRYEFVYDNIGRVTQVKRAGVTMTFTYDASGNRTERRDNNGALTTYTYDAANRLTRINYPNATSAVYGYDSLSRLTSAANQHGAVTLAYDNRSRISSTTDVWGQAVTYAYDANDNRTELRLGAAVKATYQYDALDRLTQVSDGGAFTFTYDATSKLTSRNSPNDVATTYSYDGLDRLKRLKHAKGAATIADYQHQLNAVGNITQIAEAAGAHAYTYDAADRLTAATHPSQTAESYAYDEVGNRTNSHRASTYQYQPFNRAVTIGSTTYSYDSNGNLVSKADASGAWLYAWDYENRLVSVTKPDGLIISYKYDALGRRIERNRSAGGWTRFSYDDQDVVLDTSSDGGTVEYANGLGIDEKLWQRASGGSAVYYVADHLGSTRALTDASGNVVEAQQYDSFGDGAGSTLTRYGYTGRERDADTGLYYYRARWYDPQAGRFISEDPIGLDGGVNLYAYVHENPVNATDPTGEIAWWVAPIVGGLGGGGINLGWQLIKNGGDFNCVRWRDVLLSGGIGAGLSLLGPSGPIFGRAGGKAASLGYRGGFLNRGNFRLGWSWHKGRNWFGPHGGKPYTPGHWHSTPVPGPAGHGIGGFGLGGAVVGGAIGTGLGKGPNCKCP